MNPNDLSPSLAYVDGALVMEGVRLEDVAYALGTPTYVYSRAYITNQVQRLKEAFAPGQLDIHYSVKANSNLGVLNLFRELGTGFDIVSGGELSRVLAVGGDPKKVIFSGVGKSIAEIDFALQNGIACFNVESIAELERIAYRAEILNIKAPISLRVNPNVDAQTHPYISTGLKQNKFGIAQEDAIATYQMAAANTWLDVVGIDCHIGSQISATEPLLEATQVILGIVDELARSGIKLEHVDLGGGMGITYHDEKAFDLEAYGSGVQQLLHNRDLTIVLEPGRSLVANAGVLLTRTEYLKPAATPDAPNFAIVDAAMNDLIRPALYDAYHAVFPLTENTAEVNPDDICSWDIVGPICESGDFIARQRKLDIHEDSLLAIASAGAYGMVQASNYNSRGRGCEVIVDGTEYAVTRRRETIADQMRLEHPVSVTTSSSDFSTSGSPS